MPRIVRLLPTPDETALLVHLQSVSWILAEFRHNKIVQLPRENCFNVCRQLQRKVRSCKHDV